MEYSIIKIMELLIYPSIGYLTAFRSILHTIKRCRKADQWIGELINWLSKKTQAANGAVLKRFNLFKVCFKLTKFKSIRCSFILVNLKMQFYRILKKSLLI